MPTYVYCVDDGGDGTQNNTTQSTTALDWAKADTSIANLLAYDADALTNPGNIIFIGDDHSEPGGAAVTYTFPTSGNPVILISADRTQATPTYKAGTGAQLSSLGGNYSLLMDGAVSCYGLRIACGSTGSFGFQLFVDDNEYGGLYSGCTFVFGANGRISLGGSGGRTILNNCVFDLTADGTTGRSAYVVEAVNGSCYIRGLTFINSGYRTAAVITTSTSANYIEISGCDFSGFAAATEVFDAPTTSKILMSNCKTANGTALFTSTTAGRAGTEYSLCNVGYADSPAALVHANIFGQLYSSSSIYRSSGATIEGDATSWLVITNSMCMEASPFYSPHLYGVISSTGSKTFDCYITNDTADFTDNQVWLEVEYLATADEARWTLASDQRATITTTAAAQTADTTSTWNGTGPSFTYKQKLSVTATVGETGQYRARVAVGVASIASSRYFYVDPKVTVS